MACQPCISTDTCTAVLQAAEGAPFSVNIYPYFGIGNDVTLETAREGDLFANMITGEELFVLVRQL
jgi:hypothetical protein